LHHIKKSQDSTYQTIRYAEMTLYARWVCMQGPTREDWCIHPGAQPGG